MPSKYQQIAALAEETSGQITSDTGRYMAFLSTAAHNFKYSFRDQLLIFAQRPTATACAEIGFWNSRGRWVNRGTRGIALLVDTNTPYKLRYVFDMSDTNSRTGQTVPVWQMAPRYEAAVVESLGNSYGLSGEAADLPSCLLETASLLAEDNAADYLLQLAEVKTGSHLEDLDPLNTEVWLKETMQSSIAFMLLTRCGYDPREYFGPEDFSRACDFNTPETLSVLGAAVSDVAEMALREIAATVFSQKKLERENRTVARQDGTGYDRGGRTPESENERSEQYGADLQAGGRLSVPQSQRTGGPEGREIWDAAADFPPQEPERHLHRDAADRQAERPLGGDRPAGDRDDGSAGGTDGQGAGSDQGPQSPGPDEMGGADEQHPGSSGGDGAAGADLQLTALPSEEEQRQAIAEAEVKEASAFAISQEDIDAILLRGSNVSGGKFRIFEQFQKQEPSAENIRFLKDEYGVGGVYPAIPDRNLDEWHDPSGIKISRGSISTPDTAVTLSWKKAEKRIRELIAADRYLSPAEKEKYPAYLRSKAAFETRWKVAKEFRSIVYDYNDFQTQLGKKEKCLELYILSECWGAFGSGAKKVFARKKDGEFILPLMRGAMEYIIGEDTHLTERCKAMLEDLSSPIAKPFEPTDEERNQPPKEYRLSLGDMVHLGTQEYEVIALGEETVRLFDPAFPLLNKELPRADFDRMLAENPLNDHFLQAVEPVTEQTPPDYDLGYNYLGNGLTVWNRSEKENGDYKTIAHIDTDRTVKFYVDDLPKDVQERIQKIAATTEMTLSATQDNPVFSTPPLEQVKRQEPAKENLLVEPIVEEMTPTPIGRIDFLSPRGGVTESIEYSDQEAFLAAVRKENDSGAPMSIILYRNKDGQTIPQDFKYDLDPPPQGFRVMDRQEALLEQAKELINEYCQKEFDQDADYSDLGHVPLAFSTTSKGDYPVDVSADLISARLVYQVNGEQVVVLQCHDLEDMQQYLGNLEFDEMIAYAEEQFEKQQQEKPPLSPDERFYVVDIDQGYQKAYGIWDDEMGALYVDKDGVSDEFSSRWQAEDYLEQVKRQETEKENPPVEPVADETAAPSGNGLVGSEFMAEGRRFVVDGIDTVAGTASLRDVTFQGSTGFPIFRVEPISRVQDWLKPAEKEILQPAADTTPAVVDRTAEMLQQALLANELSQQTGQMIFAFEEGQTEPVNAPAKKDVPLPPPMSSPKPRASSITIRPEIPDSQRQNFRITDDRLGEGGAKAKFQNNLAAIQTLQKIEAEGRLASLEEQEVLSRYVGWGGLPMAFDDQNGAWADEYRRLKAILPADEYESARASTLNAHYTSPTVIRAIYQGLERLGFKTGNILEPSCGIGNFLGMLPESMSESKLYGVELDSVTGRIAQQLYQKSSIAVQGFEKTDLPDSFFDAAVGNVPFGSYKVADKRYDKLGFSIHNYFFAKTLDKLRPGGVMAFVTSRYTMDAKDPTVRRYLAERAVLLGAIRLPNNAFLANAGTEVVTDILFFQKKDTPTIEEPDWVHLGQTENGFAINSYFIDHPEMVLGTLTAESTQYGREECTVIPTEGVTLAEQLANAIQNINGSIREYEMEDPEREEEDLSLPADPAVRNFSFALVDGSIYYRENSRMNPVELPVTAQGRVKGLIGIRDCVRTLIEYQTEDFPDEDIRAEQQKLNALYDSFEKKYGRINSRANRSVFEADSSYFLLSSLEVLDNEGNFKRKADMFTKRTIRQRAVVTSVDTPSEALALSLSEKGRVDIPYMQRLTGKSKDEITTALTGVIFLDPLKKEWQTADEYLSGNVREKLAAAKSAVESDPNYAQNVQALEAVQPTNLTASEISVRLGATWLPPEVIRDFMFQLFDTRPYQQWNIKVHYSKYTGGWNIEGKSQDKGIKATKTYGTERVSGYKILEDTLNLRDVRIFDYFEQDGKRVAVLNKRETAIAQGKQELIKQAFRDWIWKDPQRREQLCKLYNDRFNSVRPREYDGGHLTFPGMTPEIQLRPHQVNAIAHILYGGNTLLAHVVGAGKTFEMVAAAQESKRLGLCQKSMFVVPNHLIEQWAAEYLQLYPSANILVATKKDFETKNRKRFCSRIATGDYDAVIIGHSQFEKIPMSIQRQIYYLEREKEEILAGISELKANRGDRFSVKQMERSKKAIQAKLDKLNDQSRKDDVVTFEELGIDRLFVDEAHYYKNLAAFTKMRNVGGISQTEAQKSSDLYMKCRYLDELTESRGVIFATGTPISNTMVEMYTMQKYLQYSLLEEKGLLHFDAWASTFGETVTAIELAPEGYTFSRR